MGPPTQYVSRETHDLDAATSAIIVTTQASTLQPHRRIRCLPARDGRERPEGPILEDPETHT